MNFPFSERETLSSDETVRFRLSQQRGSVYHRITDKLNNFRLTFAVY